MHPSLFSSSSAEISELKDEKARVHIVHPSFVILQLTESTEISELKDEKARVHNVHPILFSSFSLLKVLKSVS